MKAHVSHILNAYHDQELTPQRARQVQAHLQECPDCRKELERIQALSHLLQQIPLPVQAPSADRFAAQVNLRLPRRELSTSQRLLHALWRLFPVSLVGMWGFVQAVFLVAFFLQILLGNGLFPGLAAQIPWQDTSSFSATLSQINAPGLEEVFNLLLQGITLDDPYLQGPAIYLLVQFGIGVLLCTWLASWFLSRNKTARANVRL